MFVNHTPSASKHITCVSAIYVVMTFVHSARGEEGAKQSYSKRGRGSNEGRFVHRSKAQLIAHHLRT